MFTVYLFPELLKYSRVTVAVIVDSIADERQMIENKEKAGKDKELKELSNKIGISLNFKDFKYSKLDNEHIEHPYMTNISVSLRCNFNCIHYRSILFVLSSKTNWKYIMLT